jgi:hypothetical protein
VRASDAVGNTGTASRSFTVDTVAPSLSFTQTPGTFFVNAVGQGIEYRFSASGHTSIGCRIFREGTAEGSKPGWSQCDSGFQVAIPGYGTYVVEVRAWDAAGNFRTIWHTFQNQYLG